MRFCITLFCLKLAKNVLSNSPSVKGMNDFRNGEENIWLLVSVILISMVVQQPWKLLFFGGDQLNCTTCVTNGSSQMGTAKHLTLLKMCMMNTK